MQQYGEQPYNLLLSFIYYTQHPSTMAVAYANILFPLYIHPYPLSLWQPLTDAAVKYPDITFTAVVNPSNGPAVDDKGCPDRDFVEGIASLNKHANIRTMGYVHTANSSTCGGGTDICFCTNDEVEAQTARHRCQGQHHGLRQLRH